MDATSTADANFAEAHQHAATVLRTPETELWTETREQHHLIELALHSTVIRARENFVRDNLRLQR